MKIPMGYVTKAVEMLLRSEAKKATKYLNERQIIRAVRKTYGGKFGRGNIEVTLTIGKPNYVEREFIKLCKKAGEKFPLKQVQLKFPKSK